MMAEKSEKDSDTVFYGGREVLPRFSFAVRGSPFTEAESDMRVFLFTLLIRACSHFLFTHLCL